MRVLRRFWQQWQRFGHYVGNLIGRLVLSLFYFTLFAPFGAGVSLFGDPLGIKSRSTDYWCQRSDPAQSLTDVLRQY